MQKLTRSEIIKLVCDLVEKADVPGEKPEREVDEKSNYDTIHYMWGGIDIQLVILVYPQDTHVGLTVGQQLDMAPCIISEWLPQLSAVTALACSIEAALKDVEVEA